MSRKNKIIVSIVGITIVLLALLGLTYAYYLTRIQGNTNTTSISITTADLKLEYSEGGDSNIGLTGLMPGVDIPVKTFTVTNSGNNRVDNYVVAIIDVTNTLSRTEDLTYTLTCVQKNKDGVVTGTCRGVDSDPDVEYPTQNSMIVTNSIEAGYVHEYSLKLTYVNLTDTDQSEDMGSTIKGKVQIYGLADTIDLTGNVTGASDGDYVQINSKPMTSQIVDGTYTLVGIEPGVHSLKIMNKEGVKQKEQYIKINKGEEVSVTTGSITLEDESTVNGPIITMKDTSRISTIDINKTTGVYTPNNKILDYNPFNTGTLAYKIVENAINSTDFGIEAEGYAVYRLNPTTTPAVEISQSTTTLITHTITKIPTFYEYCYDYFMNEYYESSEESDNNLIFEEFKNEDDNATSMCTFERLELKPGIEGFSGYFIVENDQDIYGNWDDLVAMLDNQTTRYSCTNDKIGKKIYNGELRYNDDGNIEIWDYVLDPMTIIGCDENGEFLVGEEKELFTGMTKKVENSEAGLSLTPDNYTESTGINSYYFRGNVKNNYVTFSNKCWRIVRIEGDGSVKLTLESQSPCSENMMSNFVLKSSNSTWGYEKEDSKDIGDYKNSTSGIKNELTTWFNATDKNTGERKNISIKAEDLLKTEEWCLGNTTNTYAYDSPYGVLGTRANENHISATNFYYETGRNISGKGVTPNATLVCNGETDSSKIGALTVDEVAFAGGKDGISNTNYYLREIDHIWFTISRSHFHGYNRNDGYSRYYDYAFLVSYGGEINGRNPVSNYIGVRPAVTLEDGVKIISGDGTLKNPYIIDEG